MRAIIVLVLLLSAVLVAAAEAEKPSAREQLTVDTPRTTPDGATFVAPGGWWIEIRGNAVILTPEGDSLIALVDTQGTDPDVAVKAANLACAVTTCSR